MHMIVDHGLHAKQLPLKWKLADCRRTKFSRLPDKNGLWLRSTWCTPTAVKVANPNKPVAIFGTSHFAWALCNSAATVRVSTPNCQHGVVAGASRPTSPNVLSVFVLFVNVKSEHTFFSQQHRLPVQSFICVCQACSCRHHALIYKVRTQYKNDVAGTIPQYHA